MPEYCQNATDVSICSIGLILNAGWFRSIRANRITFEYIRNVCVINNSKWTAECASQHTWRFYSLYVYIRTCVFNRVYACVCAVSIVQDGLKSQWASTHKGPKSRIDILTIKNQRHTCTSFNFDANSLSICHEKSTKIWLSSHKSDFRWQRHLIVVPCQLPAFSTLSIHIPSIWNQHSHNNNIVEQ